MSRPRPRFLDDVAIGLLGSGPVALVIAVYTDNTWVAVITACVLIAGVIVGQVALKTRRGSNGREIE